MSEALELCIVLGMNSLILLLWLVFLGHDASGHVRECMTGGIEY